MGMVQKILAGRPLGWVVPIIASILGAIMINNYGHCSGWYYAKGKELYENYLQPSPPGHSHTPQIHCYNSIKTLDTDNPNAQCFAVVDQHFQLILSPSEAENILLDHDKDRSEGHVHFHEGHVIPGLWDGHGHLLQYGEFLNSVDVFGAKSASETQERVKEYLESNPNAGTNDNWIRGIGWDQNILGRMPTAEDLELDPNLKGLYIMLDRVDVHCTLVSKAILDLLPADIPDVAGGEVIRDPGMGVFCDNAMDMVYDLWPRPDDAQKTEFIKSAMKELNKVGIVGMHDAGVDNNGLDLFKRLSKTQDWTVRVYAMLECTAGHNHFCPDEVSKLQFDETGGRLAVQSVKLFADGALGSWGSAMLEPYTDRPNTSGSLLVNASTLTSITTSWANAGYQVNIHAIGDLANRLSIDALEEALKLVCPNISPAECQRRRKFRIEHAQIIHPDDQQRMHEIGIIPSIQPTHATSDMVYAEKRLGEQRTKTSAYRMKSVLDLHPVLGSDFPVEPSDPFQGIYAAVTRKSPHTGKNAVGGDEGWYAEEALSLEEALWGFTRGPSAATIGNLETGVIKALSPADWVVLDKPIDEYDIEALLNMSVMETWVGGQTVYKRDV